MTISDLPKFLAMVAKQARFATARAVVIVANSTQKWITGTQLPSKLTLRTAWWRPGRKYGVNRFLSWTGRVPGENDPLTATIKSTAPWLAQNEHGATKRPRGKWIMMPNVGSQARPTQKSVMQKQWKPKPGRGPVEAGVFFKKGLRGVAVFARLTRKVKRLQLLFFLAAKAVVKPRTQVEPKGAAKAKGEFNQVYRAEFEKAMKSARP